MLGATLSTIAFLAVIVGTASATPTGSSPSLASNSLERRGSSSGRLTCVEPTGRVYNISARTGSVGAYTGTDGDDDYLVVKIDLDAAKRGPVPMEVSFSWSRIIEYFRAHKYVGAVSVSADEEATNMGPDWPGSYAVLAGTDETEAGHATQAASSFATAAYRETAPTENHIWRYNSKSRRLTPQWTNSDKSTHDLRVIYDPASRAFTLAFSSPEIKKPEWAKNAQLPESPLRECHIIFNEL